MTTIETTKPKSWYVANTGNHQGLVICAQTGVNIAIAYDKKNAPLIAQVPQLAESHAELLAALERLMLQTNLSNTPEKTVHAAHKAIAKAHGVEL